MEAEAFTGGKRRKTAQRSGAAVDTQAVFLLLVLMWIFMVSVLESGDAEVRQFLRFSQGVNLLILVKYT